MLTPGGGGQQLFTSRGNPVATGVTPPGIELTVAPNVAGNRAASQPDTQVSTTRWPISNGDLSGCVSRFTPSNLALMPRIRWRLELQARTTEMSNKIPTFLTFLQVLGRVIQQSRLLQLEV